MSAARAGATRGRLLIATGRAEGCGRLQRLLDLFEFRGTCRLQTAPQGVRVVVVIVEKLDQPEVAIADRAGGL